MQAGVLSTIGDLKDNIVDKVTGNDDEKKEEEKKEEEKKGMYWLICSSSLW